jgi:hypothetical protein
MNAAGALALSILLPVVALAPARWAFLSIMTGVLFITQGQEVSVGGFHLFAMRFIELAAIGRVLLRRELKISTLNEIDRLVLTLYFYSTLVFLVRSSEEQAFAIGVAVDACFCYFSFRALITTVEDFKWFLRSFTLLLVAYAGLVIYENVTTTNLFASMGGFVLSADGTLDVNTWSRGGRLRSYGSFRHPSLLGTLGGSFLPLYIGLFFDRKERTISAVGIASCLAIVWASNSGGPASCVLVAMIGWLLWTNRTRMQLVRRGLVATVVLAALLMKAPVWYLLARFSALTGGDGWHRSYLLDTAFRNISDWWLAGMPTKDTANWFPYVNEATGGADVTNEYIVLGIRSGLGAMILLIVLLISSYKLLGKALAVLRTQPDSKVLERLYWGIGVVLAVHTFNWFGISYFDQTYVIWFMHLAAIGSLSQAAIDRAAVVPQTAPVEVPRDHKRGVRRRRTSGRTRERNLADLSVV